MAKVIQTLLWNRRGYTDPLQGYVVEWTLKGEFPLEILASRYGVEIRGESPIMSMEECKQFCTQLGKAAETARQMRDDFEKEESH